MAEQSWTEKDVKKILGQRARYDFAGASLKDLRAAVDELEKAALGTEEEPRGDR